MRRSKAVILFTRIPVAGKTKTRLQPFLSGDGCCRLHEAFIQDIYGVLMQTDADIWVCYTPTEESGRLQCLLPGAVGMAQRGDGLGSRMNHAICDILDKGYERCVLIGSDIPLIGTGDIGYAFSLLDTYDTVISPAADGGFYLIGMKAPCPAAFDVNYTAGAVLEQTLALIKAAGKTSGIGTTLSDVDEAEDLLALAARLETESTNICPHTRMVLADVLESVTEYRGEDGYKRIGTDCSI